MRHVLLETNWVVDLVAPAHHRVEAAVSLLERATRGDFEIHVPAICFTEAQRVLRRPRFGPRNEAQAVRAYIRWATREHSVTHDDAEATRRVVSAMEAHLRREQRQVPARLKALRGTKGVTVFGLDDAMLERSIEIALEDVNLQPVDQAVLSAVLVRGASLAQGQQGSVCFVSLDKHLRPWDREGNKKAPLAAWFDDARITVFADFTLTRAGRHHDLP